MHTRTYRLLVLSLSILSTSACTVDHNTPQADTDSDSSSGSSSSTTSNGDTGSAEGDSTGPGETDGGAAPLEEVFADAVADGFSGVALVRHEGEIVFHDASGFASRADEVPNTPQTPIVIGSITKQFTGAAVLRFREQGSLELDATLGDYLTGVPADKADITLHQLLTHTAGVTGSLGPDDEEVGKDEYLQRFFDSALESEPGTFHNYSNVGYSVLAAVLEEVSGKGYQQILHDEFFEPLGMDHTGHLLPSWDGPLPAIGYLEDMADDPLARPHDALGYYWNLRGNGGLISTAEDLLLWDDALSSPGMAFDEESLELLTTPHVSEGTGAPTFYAYGWVIEETPIGSLVWHDGGNGFFYGHFYRYVDADLQVVVLANETTDAADTLTRQLAQAVRPELTPETWELLFLQEGELMDTTDTIAFETDVLEGETHAVAVSLFLTEGAGQWQLLDPQGEAVESGVVSPDAPIDGQFIVEGDPGTWRLELDVDGATGEFLAGWGRLVGQGAPCPEGAQCVELPPRAP
ncbi:MAG: serine hydrolase domain-containing protein [Nannocystales bacterium]